MRKQLGIVASLLLLAATTLVWTGCGWGSRCSNDCAPVCEQPSAPVCKPVCPEPCRPEPRPVCRPPCPEPKQDCKPVCPEPCKPVCKPACPPPACPPPACPPPAEPCKPVCKPAPAPVCPPPAAPVQCTKLTPCKHGPQGQCGCNGVTVTAKNQNMCLLGEQYPIDFDIKACQDVCDVTISTTLPEGVTFIRSTPEAKVEGRKLTWEIGHLDAGQCVPAQVWVRCEREGDLCTCFCVKATPVAFCALLCAKPVLCCEKTGPEQVCPGDPVCYTISVSNIGSSTAEEVVVTDIVPEGLQAGNCQKTLSFKLGCLEPCQTKKVDVHLTAVKRGKWTNKATATACNANQVSCEATTCVCCCAIECSKVGPKEQSIGKNADYQITVTNTGDLPLTEVTVLDTAPPCTSIVAANGANIQGNQALWRVRELKPGDKQTFNITLTTCNPGYFVNKVVVDNCQGCRGSCEAGTNWRGHPALCAAMCDTTNPLCVGDSNRYKITVTNEGQEYDNNVKLVVRLPAELKPTGAGGATKGTIDGQTVTFAPATNVAPRQNLEFYVDAEAKSSGDARVKAEVSSDFIKTPINLEESTIIN